MDATDYWLFAHKYSIWNATVAALQFWTADLDPQTLSSAHERVHRAFFYSKSAQHLWYIEEEILFSWLMTTLKHAFVWELTSEDIGYESGSKNLSVPTPLCQQPWPFYVSKQENLSFQPPLPEHAHLLVTSTQWTANWLTKKTMNPH